MQQSSALGNLHTGPSLTHFFLDAGPTKRLSATRKSDRDVLLVDQRGAQAAPSILGEVVEFTCDRVSLHINPLTEMTRTHTASVFVERQCVCRLARTIAKSKQGRNKRHDLSLKPFSPNRSQRPMAHPWLSSKLVSVVHDTPPFRRRASVAPARLPATQSVSLPPCRLG